MRKYKESVDAAALSKLSRDELAALDQQIETMLRENNVYVDEIYSYQEEHSGVRHIQFDLSGDWKHEHLKTKLLMEQQGWSIYSKEEIGESASDYYEAHYDFVYDKDFEAYTNNMFTPEEKAQLGKLFEEDYSPSLLNDLVNDYRYEYSAETHNEIWNKILEMYNDEDLANDVLAALEDGDEYYEDDDDEYLTESEEDDDDDEEDKYRHLEWDDINEIYNSALESAVDAYDGDSADVDGESMYDDFITYLDKWNKMSNEEKDQYESIEDYFKDNINYEDYIPEADDDDDEEELNESEIDDDDDEDCDTDYFDEIVANAVAFFDTTDGATDESFKEYLRENYPNVADWMLVPLWNAFVYNDGKTVTFQEI